MIGPFRVWSRVRDPIDRTTYVAHGFGLAALKYAGDVLIVYAMSGRLWTPVDYLRFSSILSNPQDVAMKGALGLWAVPFVWLGVTLSMRRALHAGLSPWFALFFFVPYVNYALMAALSIVPGGAPRLPFADEPRMPDTRAWPAFVAAISAGVLGGLVLVVMPLLWFERYAGAIFLGTPFVMGVLTAFVLNRRYPATRVQTIGAVWLMLGVSAGLALLLAIEGVVCIAMALPIAGLAALFGALFGATLAGYGPDRPGSILLPLLFVPLSITAEPPHGRDVHEVVSAIDIDAPPAAVWENVIRFPEIDAPSEIIFRAGIAYPMSARIDGTGPGAIRYCVFSTGAFVEPIVAWEPGVRLAFDVVSAPAPLRELTPWQRLRPPHLDGYLRPVRGEFRLVALGGNRTRLEGSTWYTLDMGPEPYWSLWVDAIVHRIHMRVLEHIKKQAER